MAREGKLVVGEVAAHLTKPFLMEAVATVDHFAVYLYLCRGFVAQHKHVDQDELFYVYRGLLSLRTDWGNSTLSQNELAVVPRGLTHISGSLTPSVILFFQAQSEPEQKNGHGRLTVGEHEGPLPRVRVEEHVPRLTRPYLGEHLAQVDEMSLRAVRCQGATVWHRHADHDELLWMHEGTLEVGTEHGALRLEQDELTVIRRGTIHRLSTPARATALSLIHGAVTPEQHMGLHGQTGLD
jgi:homogentisate 1,2-dioxygenase